MARSKFSLFPLIFTILLVAGAAAELAASAAAPSTSFIKASCSTTQYPALCFQSLSSYAEVIRHSPSQLVQTALSVSLNKTSSAQAFVKRLSRFTGLRPRERAAVKDCIDLISDGLSRVSSSIKEIKSYGGSRGSEFSWHMSNVQTWVSAALTDESTCMDGFAGRGLDGRVKTSVRAWMTGVAQVTSNALALVNNFANKH